MINIDLDFLTRVIKTTFWVTGIVAISLAYYYNYIFAIGLVIGSFWNIINFWLIRKIVSLWLSDQPKKPGQLIVIFLVKFPVLYGIGYWILQSGYITAGSFLCGFSLLLLVIVLKAVGIMIISQQQS